MPGITHLSRTDSMQLTLSPVDDRKKMPFIIDIPDNPQIEAEILIGRGPECDVQIPQRFVSRRHCGIMVDTTAKSMRICDFGSQNGTFVNDEQVTRLREIVNGDKLTVGFLPLRIEISGDVSVWDRLSALSRPVPIGQPRRMSIVAVGGTPSDEPSSGGHAT
jgi:predicted component of type VI protein secretion system